VRLPIAREGWPFILGAAALFGFCLALKLPWAPIAALVLTAFIIWFFRDPERSVPAGDDVLVSPADGKVIELLPQPDGGVKVGIFLSIFDVHVNRLPASGEITDVSYRRGRFLAAWNTIASDENERCAITIVHSRGTVRVVQVAGLIARRIICRIKPGQTGRQGERYGLIRFGSRVDTYLPAGAPVAVKIGDRVKGGADIIAHWS
jgi:phosphatidylserine decarboxylase